MVYALSSKKSGERTLICGENCHWGQGLTQELPRYTVCQLTDSVIKMCVSHHVCMFCAKCTGLQLYMLEYLGAVCALSCMESRWADESDLTKHV